VTLRSAAHGFATPRQRGAARNYERAYRRMGRWQLAMIGMDQTSWPITPTRLGDAKPLMSRAMSA
jgi:hypothetical protein